MDELKKELLEGEQIDNLEGTSPSSEEGVELNSSPVPTPEEKEEAAMVSDGTNGNVGDLGDEVLASDTPEVTENVVTENIEGAEPVMEQPEPEKTFTQSQVNDLVGKTRMETREQTYRAVYGRYGVEDEAGMDELVGNAQRYETIRGEYDEARKGWEASDAANRNELMEVKEHVALLESGIDRARFDDAKAIMKAKGLEITVDNINNELATHPEWKGTKNEEAQVNPNFRPDPNGQPQQLTPTPESTIKVLGNDSDLDTGGMSEEEYAMKNLFKL